MRILKKNSGICLIEVMIAMAAGIVVLMASIQTLNHFQQRLSAQHDTIAVQQDQRIGMKIFEDELRIAGSHRSDSLAALLQAKQQEIEFDANITGETTNLTKAVSSSDQELSVMDGTGWAKGKRILICVSENCTENRLAEDGQGKSLRVVVPFPQTLPVGSEISISNRVRYYLSKGRSGKVSLMRQVDGGANPLINDVTFFALSYVDKTGRPTMDPSIVARVKIELAVGKDHRTLTSEVGIRG
ncbi:MAG TPA: hypothetical protein VJ692_14300 [Nitrospiraceae bacterium]|nr:hypothetical protein [Nitrospiraceae bacterium]